MSEDYDFNLKKHLSVADDQGTIVIQISLLATFYFDTAHLPQTQKAVSECFEEYIGMCGENLRWVAHPKDYSWRRIGSYPVPLPKEWFQSQNLGEGDSWEFDYHGGKQPDEASHFAIRAVGTSKLMSEKRGRLSYIGFYLPLTWFADHPGNFPELVSNWCQKLRPLHGYGGIGISESPEYSVA